MTERYHISGRLDPTRSVLGRIVCRSGEDHLRSENRYYLLAIGGLMAYLVVVFLAWAWMNMEGTPAPAEASTFWTWQATALGAVLAISWLGVRPSVCVTVSDEGLQIRVGRRAPLWLHASCLRSVSRIEAIVHHQHYRLYANTRSFIGAPHATFVLIRTEEEAWVLGVTPAEQNGMVERVSAVLAENRAKETLVA